MKETPIIMKPELAFAAHVGDKTNTLRIINFKIEIVGNERIRQWSKDGKGFNLTTVPKLVSQCPYGLAGDHLWVKETHYAWGRWLQAEDGKRTFQHIGREEKCRFAKPHLVATGEFLGWHKRPSIFMPKDFSRTRLLIKSIMPMRLGDLTEEIARCEGMPRNHGAAAVLREQWDPDEHGYLPINWLSLPDDGKVPYYTALEALKETWRVINGEWDDQTWVWSIAFRRIEDE